MVAKDWSVLFSGIAMLPYTATIAPGATATGILIAKTGKYRMAIIVGWVLITAGVGLFMKFEKDSSLVAVALIPVTSGIGFGIVTSALKFAGQAFASNADLPFASGLNMFFRSLGQCLGVAVGGTIFSNAFSKQLSGQEQFAPFAAEWTTDASALVAAIDSIPANLRDVLVDCYVEALKKEWIVMTAFAGAALLLCIFGIKEKTLERKHETDQGLNAGQRTDSSS